MGRDRSRDRKKKKRKHDRSRSRDRKKKRRRRSSSSDSDYRRRRSKKSSRKHKKRSRYSSSSSSSSSRSRTRSRSSSADSNKPLKPLYESTKDILKREKIEAEQQAKQKELEEAKLEAAKKLGKTIETDDGKTEINDVAEAFSTDKINMVTMKRKHRIEAARRNKQGLKNEEEEKKPKKEKGWNLENDDSDDEEPLPDPDKEENPDKEKMETEEKPEVKEEEEIDPLDAFMLNLQGATKQDYKKKRPARVKVVRKVETEDAITKRKGEIIESNQDAMEYSDEDREDDIDKKMKEIKALKEKEARRLLDPSKKIKHDEMHYEPFKKDFYIEIQELAEMNEIEIKEARLALENIKVRGVDCPAPVNNWSQLER